LAAWVAGAWLLLAVPAYWFWGDEAVVQAAVAAGLCLLPALATLAWATWTAGRSPEHQLAMALGGTGVRLGVVLCGGLAIYFLVPGFRQVGFWIWVVVFYVVTLALEIGLIVARLSAAVRASEAGARPTDTGGPSAPSPIGR
jgi:hypothetical protein